MNQYLFFVNGRLMAPDFFNIRMANTANDGRVAILSVSTDVVPSTPPDKFDVDVLEVRASNIVQRFRFEHKVKSEEEMEEERKRGETPAHRVLPAGDDAPERHEFRAFRVPNDF